MDIHANEDGWRTMPNGVRIFVFKGETLEEAFARVQRVEYEQTKESKHRDYLQ